MSKSILQDKKACWFCNTTANLHRHHVFFGIANRKKSEKYGLTVWLCPKHHNLSKDSVHRNADRNHVLQSFAQRCFEIKHNHNKFMEIFGRDYTVKRGICEPTKL